MPQRLALDRFANVQRTAAVGMVLIQAAALHLLMGSTVFAASTAAIGLASWLASRNHLLRAINLSVGILGSVALFVLKYSFAANEFPFDIRFVKTDLAYEMACCCLVVQLLVLFAFVAIFKDTTLFNPRAFAVTIIVAAVAWVASQARAALKAKIFYIDPDPSDSSKNEKSGSSS